MNETIVVGCGLQQQLCSDWLTNMHAWHDMLLMNETIIKKSSSGRRAQWPLNKLVQYFDRVQQDFNSSCG